MWVEKHRKTWRIREERGATTVNLMSGIDTKTAAKRLMAQLKAEQIRGDQLVLRGGQMPLNAWIDEWWPGYENSLKPTSAHSEGGRVRNHIRKLLGTLTLDQVDALAVQQWVNLLGAGVKDEAASTPGKTVWTRKPLAPKTVHNCHGVLFVIMQAAVGQRLIRLNPCAGTALPARVQKEMRFLTDPEIARLITALPEHWRPLVMLLVATGVRWGEAIGLKGGRVDLLSRPPKLVIIEQMQEMSNTGELIFMSPKSAKSRRTVSFTLQVALVLTGLVAAAETGELIFRTPTGLPIRTRNFRRVWLTTIKKAGLPGLRVHDLRHTHAAILIAANRPLSAISRRLGHSTIAVTDALYGHLREEVDEGILTAVEAALSQVSAEDLAAEIAEELALDEAA